MTKPLEGYGGEEGRRWIRVVGMASTPEAHAGADELGTNLLDLDVRRYIDPARPLWASGITCAGIYPG
jgi:hypothetical protein